MKLMGQRQHVPDARSGWVGALYEADLALLKVARVLEEGGDLEDVKAQYREAQELQAIVWGGGGGGVSGGGGTGSGASLNRIDIRDRFRRSDESSLLDCCIIQGRVDVIAWVVEETEAPVEQPHEPFDKRFEQMLQQAPRHAPISGWAGMVEGWKATIERRRVEREFMPG